MKIDFLYAEENNEEALITVTLKKKETEKIDKKYLWEQIKKEFNFTSFKTDLFYPDSKAWLLSDEEAIEELIEKGQAVFEAWPR